MKKLTRYEKHNFIHRYWIKRNISEFPKIDVMSGTPLDGDIFVQITSMNFGYMVKSYFFSEDESMILYSHLYTSMLGICALPLRSTRRGVPHFSITGKFLQNTGRDCAEYIQYAWNQISLSQAERLPVLGRERFGNKSGNVYVQYVPEPVSNGPSEKAMRMCSVFLQATEWVTLLSLLVSQN